jgi:hypothetical protein
LEGTGVTKVNRWERDDAGFEHDHFFHPSVRSMLAAPAPIVVAHGLVSRSANDRKFREAALCWSLAYGQNDIIVLASAPRLNCSASI